MVTALSRDEQLIESLAKIWVQRCELQCPADSWLSGLVRANGLAAAEYAVKRTGRRLRSARETGEHMDAEAARRYCQSVASHNASGPFPDRQAPAARQNQEAPMLAAGGV